MKACLPPSELDNLSSSSFSAFWSHFSCLGLRAFPPSASYLPKTFRVPPYPLLSFPAKAQSLNLYSNRKQYHLHSPGFKFPKWEPCLSFSCCPLYLTSDSDSKESACNAGDLGSIRGLRRCPGGGHGNPLQYSCLENPHGQRSLAGYSLWGHKELDTTEGLSTAHTHTHTFRMGSLDLVAVQGTHKSLLQHHSFVIVSS